MKKYTLEDLKREQQEILDKIESININIGSNKNLTDDEVNKLKDEKSILEKQVEKFNKLIDIITYNILLTRSIKGHDERIVNLNNKIEVLEEEYKNGKITKEQYDQTIYNLNINLKFFKEEKDRVTRVRKRKEKEAEKIKNTLYNNEEDISNDIKKQANVNLEGYESLIKNIISDKDISNVEKKERLNTFRSLIDTAIKTLEEVDIDENKKGKIDNNLLSEKDEAYLHIIKEKEDLEKKLQEAINEMLRVFEEEKLKKENEGPFTEEELSKIEVYYYEKKQLIDREIESLKREIKKISKKQKELDNEINVLNNNNATLMLEDKQAKLDNNKVLSLTGPIYENSEDKKYLDTIKEILRLGPEANNINLGYVLEDEEFVKELIANLKDKFSENELDFVFSDDIEKTERDQEKLNDFAEYFVKSLYTKALNNSDIEIDDIENKTSDELEEVLINNDISLEELENLFTKDNDINKDDKYNNTLNSFINLLKEEDGYDYTFLLDDDYKEFYNELINKLKNMNLSDEELDKVKENDVENLFDEVFFDTIKDKIKSERGLSDEEFKSLGIDDYKSYLKNSKNKSNNTINNMFDELEKEKKSLIKALNDRGYGYLTRDDEAVNYLLDELNKRGFNKDIIDNLDEDDKVKDIFKNTVDDYVKNELLKGIGVENADDLKPVEKDAILSHSGISEDEYPNAYKKIKNIDKDNNDNTKKPIEDNDNNKDDNKKPIDDDNKKGNDNNKSNDNSNNKKNHDGLDFAIIRKKILSTLTEEEAKNYRDRHASLLNASNIKCSQVFKNGLRYDNYLYNILSIVPTLVKTGVSFFAKLTGKLLLSKKAKQALEKIETEVSKLSDEEIEYLMGFYNKETGKLEGVSDHRIIKEGTTKGEMDILSKAVSSAMMVKLNRLVSANDRYSDFVIKNQTKLSELYTKLNSKDIDEATREKVGKELEELSVAMNQAMKEYDKNKSEIDSINGANRGIHSVSETNKATSSKMNLKGKRFAKNRIHLGAVNESAEIAEDRIKADEKLKNAKTEDEFIKAFIEKTDAFTRRDEFYLKHQKIKNSIFGKVSAGATVDIKDNTVLDYNPDPFIRNLMSTIATTAATVNLIQTIVNHFGGNVPKDLDVDNFEKQLNEKNAEIAQLEAKLDALSRRVDKNNRDIAGYMNNDSYDTVAAYRSHGELYVLDEASNRTGLNWPTHGDVYDGIDHERHIEFNGLRDYVDSNLPQADFSKLSSREFKEYADLSSEVFLTGKKTMYEFMKEIAYPACKQHGDKLSGLDVYDVDTYLHAIDQLDYANAVKFVDGLKDNIEVADVLDSLNGNISAIDKTVLTDLYTFIEQNRHIGGGAGELASSIVTLLGVGGMISKGEEMINQEKYRREAKIKDEEEIVVEHNKSDTDEERIKLIDEIVHSNPDLEISKFDKDGKASELSKQAILCDKPDDIIPPEGLNKTKDELGNIYFENEDKTIRIIPVTREKLLSFDEKYTEKLRKKGLSDEDIISELIENSEDKSKKR